MNKKLGYYSVGSKIFDKKIEALIYATKIYKNFKDKVSATSLISWNFNDEIFYRYNWELEPKLSLKDLYQKRAKALREKYDYVIISYSGGADSHNIVMSFLDQGLFIDELYVLMVSHGSSQWNVLDINNTNSTTSYVMDNYYQTLPRLKEILNKSPGTKIRYLDMTKLVFDVFKEYKDASWVLNMREELNPADVTRYNYSYFSDFKKTLDKHKHVGVIVGIDKPRIVIDSNTKLVYTKFIDRLTNAVPIGEYIREYSNTVVEFFYWSPDACDLLCKQAHVVKKWLEINKHMQGFFENNPAPVITYGNTLGVDYNRVFSERMLRSILYDNWHPSWFQATKNSRDWFLECDNWFIKGAKGTKEHSIWLEGIKYIIDNTDPYISKDIAFPDSFLKWHKSYCIGRLRH